MTHGPVRLSPGLAGYAVEEGRLAGLRGSAGPGHGARIAAVGGDARGSDGGGRDDQGRAGAAPRRSVQFTVPGQPIGKGRPIAGRGFGGHTTLRTPAKTVNYESTVRLFAAQAMAGAPLFEGPVKVGINIECAIPASWSKKKQAKALSGQVRPTTKPDCDNVAKSALDAMNGAVFRDDVQAVLLVVSKAYGAAPGLQVIVEALDAEAA